MCLSIVDHEKKMKLIPAHFGWGEAPWTSHQSSARPVQRQTTIHTYRKLRVVCMSLDCGRKLPVPVSLPAAQPQGIINPPPRWMVGKVYCSSNAAPFFHQMYIWWFYFYFISPHHLFPKCLWHLDIALCTSHIHICSEVTGFLLITVQYRCCFSKQCYTMKWCTSSPVSTKPSCRSFWVLFRLSGKHLFSSA